MAEHVVSKRTYFAVFIALIILAGLTTALAFIDLGPFNTVVALTIAVAKASLVALFFMHLRWSSRLLHFVGVAALLWLAILISLALSDVFTRDWVPQPRSRETPTAQLRPSVRKGPHNSFRKVR